MRTIELPGNKSITLRVTAKELPIDRYADFQKYLVQAAGIGSTMGHVEEHFGRLHRFIAAQQSQEAAREAYNLHLNLHLMLNKIDIDSLAFCALVDSIETQEGEKKTVEKITDYSEDGLVRLSGRLGAMGLTRLQVEEIIADVKKKSIQV